MDRGLADARRKTRTYQREVAADSRKAAQSAKAQEKARAKSMQSIRGGVSQGFGQALSMGGIDGIAGAASEVRDFQRDMDRFGIVTGQSQAKVDELGRSIREVSSATGIGANEIAKAAGVWFDKTSDAEGTAKAMSQLARVAAATGSEMEVIITVAAAMGDSLGIASDQMEGVFGSLVAQGKAGKIGLKDMASVFTELLPKFSRFKGAMGADGVIQLGAAFQVAAKGFGTAEKAATGLEALIGALGQNAAKFEAVGVKIFDVDKKTGMKTFRDLHETIVAIGDSKLGKDPTLLNKAFGSKEAEGAFFQLNKLRGMYDDVARAGSEGAQTIGQDFQKWIETPSGRIERSMERIKNKIAEAFTPERIDSFAKALGSLVEVVGKVGEGFGSIHKAGQDIRGEITGENHITTADRMLARAGDPRAQMKIDDIKGSANYAAIRAADSSKARQFLGINATSSADLARQYSQAEGPGAFAKRAAAERYFKEQGAMAAPAGAQAAGAGASAAVVSALPGGDMTMTQMMGLLKQIATNTANSPPIKIGADEIQKAASNSTRHRYHK